MNLFFRTFIILCSILLMVSCASDQTLPNSTDNHSRTELISENTHTVTSKDLKLYSEEMQQIHQNGELIISLYSQDRYPFFYVDSDGNLAGSDIEIAKSIATSFGVKAVFDRSAQTFDEVVDNVASGKADLAISKLSQTLPRGKKVIFTEPYINLHQALLINRLELARFNTTIEQPYEWIKNSSEKIGVIEGTSYINFAQDTFRDAQLIEYDNKDALINATIHGHVLAAFYDEFEVRQYIQNNPAKSIDLQIEIIEDRVDSIAIAVAPHHQHLLAWLNIYLKTNKSQIDNLLRSYGIIK